MSHFSMITNKMAEQTAPIQKEPLGNDRAIADAAGSPLSWNLGWYVLTVTLRVRAEF